MTGSHDVTDLLANYRAGERGAVERILPVLYDELRELAARELRGERRDHTLQVTALVHEAFLKLVAQDRQDYSNRAHFLAIAAQAMRRVLLHHAEKRRAAKRGGGGARVTLHEAQLFVEDRSADVLAVDEALQRLATLDADKARLVELRYFGGMTAEECAEALGMSQRTVEREWRFARAWLRADLTRGEADETPNRSGTDPSPPRDP